MISHCDYSSIHSSVVSFFPALSSFKIYCQVKIKIYLFTDKPKNQCSSETTKQQRRRGINLNEDCGLDLVFLFDASVSVNRYYFQTSLEFAKELLTVIGASKRYQRFALLLSELSVRFKTAFL